MCSGSCTCILYTGGLCCGCWEQVSARWQSSESLCWMKCVVELTLLGGHVAWLFPGRVCLTGGVIGIIMLGEL